MPDHFLTVLAGQERIL